MHHVPFKPLNRPISRKRKRDYCQRAALSDFGVKVTYSFLIGLIVWLIVLIQITG